MIYIKIKYILFLSCISLNIIIPNENKQGFMLNFFIPLEVQVSLDFLKAEIENYKNELQNDWDGQKSQNIIKKAEHIAQSPPKNFQDDVTKKIIEFFNDINIKIRFNDTNLTIIRDDYKNKNSFDALDDPIYIMEQKEEQLKKIKQRKDLNEKQLAKKHTKTITPIKFKPKKIKGARKSMKKLRKYRDDQRKKELARKRELSEFFNARRRKIQEEEKQEITEKEEKTNEIKINQKIIESALLKEPTSHLVAERKNVLPTYKKPIPKKSLESHRYLPQENQIVHELFATPGNLN